MKLSTPVPVAAAAVLAIASVYADAPAELPQITVYSPRVANQAPVGAFAMPVSSLRYEPRLDLHGRNSVEGQADVTMRGGIFENTGFRVGAVSIVDPQTGHYLAESPVAPAMLGAPDILLGADVASLTTNATSGAVSYAWRPIRTVGAVQAGFGPDSLRRGEVYQGYMAPARGELRLAADVDVAHSESDGPIRYGDHEFDRVGARLQLQSPRAQTDLMAAYQAKFFGWPNMYTPFNSFESENLQTLLFAANHRVDLGAGDYFSAALFNRRNKDDYAFNRFAPLGAAHPFQHTTWVTGSAAELKRSFAAFGLHARAELMADRLKSTSLVWGRYSSRTLAKLALVPEKTWSVSEREALTVKLGATYDDSNRKGGVVSPVFEAARTFGDRPLRRVYVSYHEATQLPSYTALNSNARAGLFRGNPDLGRTFSRSAEVGASGRLGAWTFQAAAFARRDDALVDWTFVQRLATGAINERGARAANAVDVDTVGFEAVARASWTAIDLVIGYTALAKDSDYRGAAVDASFYALNYARHRLTAAVTARLGHGFELRLDNVARLQAPNLLRTIGGDEALITTAALAYRPPAWRHVEFVAQVDNAWDSRFQDIPAVPASPRTWSVGATYVW